MKKRKRHGFSVLVLIAILAVIALGVVIAWRVLDSSNQSNLTQTNQTAQNQQPVDQNAGYVVIKEWGVRFKPVEGLSGVQYFKPHKDLDAISITTQELGNLDPNCGVQSPMAVLGILTRSKDPQIQNGGVITKIGEFSFQYRGSGAACSKDSQNWPKESSILLKIKESLPSLEPSK